jgi:hypothetical protein
MVAIDLRERRRRAMLRGSVRTWRSIRGIALTSRDSSLVCERGGRRNAVRARSELHGRQFAGIDEFVDPAGTDQPVFRQFPHRQEHRWMGTEFANSHDVAFRDT